MNKNIGITISILVLAFIAIFIFTGNKKNDSMMKDQMEDKKMMESNSQTMTEGEKIKDQETMVKDQNSMIDKGGEMMKPGSYESYAPEKIMKAMNGNVVLFFHASWCPSCISVDKDIKANLSKIPSDLTILDVNYDNSSDLKKKYGVTYQHTFVQVDKDGNMIKKWSGSATLVALVNEVK